jgi:hypothetical protein
MAENTNTGHKAEHARRSGNHPNGVRSQKTATIIAYSATLQFQNFIKHKVLPFDMTLQK